MSADADRLYADSRLVAVYDLFNAGDHDFAFYAAVIGAARQRDERGDHRDLPRLIPRSSASARNG